MEDAHDDPTFEILDNQMDPLYYVLILFSVVHLAAVSALFLRQRMKFPVCGHNAKLSLFLGVRLESVVRGVLPVVVCESLRSFSIVLPVHSVPWLVVSLLILRP